MPVRSRLRAATALAAALVLAPACTTRFVADFEADSAGSPPDSYPAGDPDDQISILDVGASGSILVSNSAPLAGAKSLRFVGPGSSSLEAFLYAEPMQWDDERKYASFAGRHDGPGAFQAALFSGHFVPLGGVRLEGGTVHAVQYPEEGDATSSEIGSYQPGGQHTVLLNVHPVTRELSVSVVGAGVPSGTATTFVVPPTRNGTARFPIDALGLRAQLVGGSGSSSYRMDTVRMSERTPPD